MANFTDSTKRPKLSDYSVLVVDIKLVIKGTTLVTKEERLIGEIKDIAKVTYLALRYLSVSYI